MTRVGFRSEAGRMVIDTSALLAVAFREVERDRFMAAILSADPACMAAANWAEAVIVADRRLDQTGRDEFDLLFERLGIQVVPFTAAQARLARTAYRQFGLHSAAGALNYGDCFAYALAKDLNQPLLFKGNDFSQTDIKPA